MSGFRKHPTGRFFREWQRAISTLLLFAGLLIWASWSHPHRLTQEDRRRRSRHLAIRHLIAAAAQAIQKFVQADSAFWGGLPFKRYVFLNLFRRGGGGLEHLNSTLLTSAANPITPRAVMNRLWKQFFGTGLSKVLDDLGDYAQALEHQLRALAIDERNGDDASRALTLRTIGIVHSKAGDPQRGLEFYTQSLALTRACGHDAASARTLNNIGINHKNLGNHVEALSALEEALALFRRTDSRAGEAAVLNNMGLTLERLERLDDAENCQRASIEIARQVGYTIAEARALKALGDLLIQRDRMPEARDALDQALAVAERINARPELALVHRALSDLHKRSGQPGEALAHFERYHQLEREVFNESSDRKLKSLQIAYQTEQAKREAEIHRLRHVELVRANDELQKLNDTLINADATKTQLLAKLERLSQEDSLTGLANRRHFDAHLAEMFARARRDATPLAVALADLDFFKQINDRCGHATGDEVLRVVARIMREHGRANDLAARYGGEEFAFVFPCTDAAGAAVVCEKIRAAVEGYAWAALHPHLLVTISIGICDRTDVISHEKMLALADDRLYQAKYGGKNQVRLG